MQSASRYDVNSGRNLVLSKADDIRFPAERLKAELSERTLWGQK